MVFPNFLVVFAFFLMVFNISINKYQRWYISENVSILIEHLKVIKVSGKATEKFWGAVESRFLKFSFGRGEKSFFQTKLTKIIET